MTQHPRWFWQATFYGGSTATFYGDNKGLAYDHAVTLARDFGKRGVSAVKRLKHSKDVTPEENAAAGRLHEPQYNPYPVR